MSGQQEDKIKTAHFNLDNGRRVETPWISECLAHIECAVTDIITPGDHSLFIVEVVGAWAEKSAFDDGIWLCPEDEEMRPLLHLGGTVFALLSNKINIQLHQDKG